MGPGPILTDNQPLVEYFLSLPRDREVDLSPLKGDVRPHRRRGLERDHVPFMFLAFVSLVSFVVSQRSAIA